MNKLFIVLIVCIFCHALSAMISDEELDFYCALSAGNDAWFDVEVSEPCIDDVRVVHEQTALQAPAVVAEKKDSIIPVAKPHKFHKRVYERYCMCPYDGCLYKTRYSGNMVVHKRKHESVLSYVCDVPGCEYASTSSSNLERHKLRKHTAADARPHYPCLLCAYVALQPWLLKVHMRKHTHERPYKCPVDGCLYKTTTKCNLNRHCKAMHESDEYRESEI